MLSKADVLHIARLARLAGRRKQRLKLSLVAFQAQQLFADVAALDQQGGLLGQALRGEMVGEQLAEALAEPVAVKLPGASAQLLDLVGGPAHLLQPGSGGLEL